MYKNTLVKIDTSFEKDDEKKKRKKIFVCLFGREVIFVHRFISSDKAIFLEKIKILCFIKIKYMKYENRQEIISNKII